MRSKSTVVGLIYIAGAALLAFTLDKALTSLFATLNVANRAVLGDNFTLSTLVGLVIAVATLGYLYVHAASKRFVVEVVDEVGKIAWPAWSETKTSTVVVIIFSFLCAGILGVFDSVFSWLTNSAFFGA